MVKIYKIILPFFLIGLVPLSALAATLSFSQPADSYAVGSTFSVSIYTGSSDQAMNTAVGVISFPRDKLEVVSLSKTGSIFSMWIKEPSFSNSAGAISFEGTVLNPGYTGTRGKILTITFKAKTAGLVDLSFSSGLVLANDGLGTNILTSQNGTSFIISPTESVTSAPKQLTEGCEALPKIDIVSSTNQPDTWVSNRGSSFSWIIPAGAIAIQTSLSARTDSVPSVNYVPPISKKDLINTPDGIWYFNLRYKIDGCWSDISRYNFKIDTVAPIDLQAKIVEIDNGKKLALELSAKDALSGVDQYEIVADDKDRIIVLAKDLVNGQYLLNNIPAGGHNLKIRAFDLAGNSSQEFSLVVNIPLSELSRTISPSIFQTLLNKEVLRTVLLAIIILGILILLYCLLSKKQLTGKKSQTKVDIGDIAVFSLMENDLRKYIKALKKAKEKRSLSDEEVVILKGLKKDLNDVEDLITKEIKDIEKS